MKTSSLRFALTGLATLTGMTLSAQAFDHSHSDFGAVLEKHVNASGMVDYAALKADRAKLDGYVESLGSVSRGSFDGWSPDQQIAFLINVYNAETLQLIIDNYPVKSIKRIGGLLGLGSPFEMEVVQLFGKTTTLNHVEHGVLREEFKEPRIHFALVCAAMGCPPLRTEPFVAERLDTQLEEQAATFLGQTEKNRVENGTLYLSPIFRWFSEDFTAKAGSVAAYVNPWFDENTSDLRVKYTDYDWSLNEQG